MEDRIKGPWRLLFKFAIPYKWGYMKSIILAILGVASGFVPYFAMADIIIKLIEGERQTSFYVGWCGICAIAYLLKVIFASRSTMASHKATFAVLSEIRKSITAKLAKVPMGYILETPSGKLKTTLCERVDMIEIPLAHIVPEMTSNILVPIGIVVYIAFLDWRMALAALLTVPFGFLGYCLMMRGYTKKYTEVAEAGKQMSATTVEYINGIEVIKAFNQSTSPYEKFVGAVHKNSALTLNWMRSTSWYTAFMYKVLPAVLAGVLPIGGILYMRGTLTASDFITIIILSFGIMGPLNAAINFTQDIANMGTIVGDVGRVLNEPEMDRPPSKNQLCGSDIKLENVCFGYKEKEVLHHINLSIPAGTVTALVGPSGSGKSTIAKLIASQWDVKEGAVYFGGTDIRNIPLSQLMEHITYVSQDNYLFDDTVRNNIRMGRSDASDEEVEAAAKASGCHEFILRLEHGYDTKVGDAGGHLSGGERQRIAIARAMLKNAEIVILDEATSYTDPENEAVIQEAVARLIKGRTLIVIAHRLSTITDADNIVVVEKGQITAQGKHEELLKSCGLYQKMWAAHNDARDQ